MKTDCWMPLYWGDLIADTLHLNRSDFGSYVLLIGAYWRNGGPLPDDDDQLRTITRCQPQEWARTKGILTDFFTLDNGHWHHKRIDLELRRSQEAQTRRHAQVAGALAARGITPKNVTSNVTSHVTLPVTSVQSQSQSQSQVQPESQSEKCTAGKNSDFPSLEQVKTRASMIMMPETDAVAFWNHFESVGWIDKNGHPIVRWESKMDNWKTNARSEQFQLKGSKTPTTPVNLKIVLEAKKSLASSIRTQYCSDGAMSSHWSNDSKKAEYFGIRREIKALERQISNLA